MGIARNGAQEHGREIVLFITTFAFSLLHLPPTVQHICLTHGLQEFQRGLHCQCTLARSYYELRDSSDGVSTSCE